MNSSTPARAGACGSVNVTPLNNTRMPAPGEQAVEFATISQEAMALGRAAKEAEAAAIEQRHKELVSALRDCRGLEKTNRAVTVSLPNGITATFEDSDPIAAIARLIKLAQ